MKIRNNLFCFIVIGFTLLSGNLMAISSQKSCSSYKVGRVSALSEMRIDESKLSQSEIEQAKLFKKIKVSFDLVLTKKEKKQNLSSKISFILLKNTEYKFKIGDVYQIYLSKKKRPCLFKKLEG